jgi:hypothetical protein
MKSPMLTSYDASLVRMELVELAELVELEGTIAEPVYDHTISYEDHTVVCLVPCP